MAKRIAAFALALIVAFLLAACGTKELTCDYCGAKVKVSANSNMTEEWMIACRDCTERLGLDKLVE